MNLRNTVNNKMLLFSMCIIPAIFEEIAFRGLLQRWLMAAFSHKKALALTAALFSLLHFSIVSFPYLFMLGLLFGYIKWKTESLYPVIILHFIHNFIVVFFFNI